MASQRNSGPGTCGEPGGTRKGVETVPPTMSEKNPATSGARPGGSSNRVGGRVPVLVPVVRLERSAPVVVSHRPTRTIAAPVLLPHAP
jgi:hypothetical protein